jgi:hypothetical protein
LVQGATVLTRGASTVTTGGLANPVFATVELGGAVITSIAAILAPVALVVLLVIVFAFFGRKLLRRFRNPQPKPV